MTVDDKNILTDAELAHLGEGSLAYLREIDSDELTDEMRNRLQGWVNRHKR